LCFERRLLRRVQLQEAVVEPPGQDQLQGVVGDAAGEPRGVTQALLRVRRQRRQ
jgi:hypothetical protein